VHLSKAAQAALDRLRERGDWTSEQTLKTSRGTMNVLIHAGLVKRKIVERKSQSTSPGDNVFYIAKEHYHE